jgi:hypothetical protein
VFTGPHSDITPTLRRHHVHRNSPNSKTVNVMLP